MGSHRYTEDDGLPGGVLKLLGQNYSLQILLATSDEARSTQELIERFEIPRTTLYRRLRGLEEHDLVRLEGQVDPEGAHSQLVRCNLEGLELTIDDGAAIYEVVLGDEAPAVWNDAWSKVRARNG